MSDYTNKEISNIFGDCNVSLERIEKWAEASRAERKFKWVGLTDDEVFDLADENLYNGGKSYGILSFYRAIEAKLKEQNNG